MSRGAFYTCKGLFAINPEGNMSGINLNSEHSSGNHYAKTTLEKSNHVKLQFHKN